MLNRFHFASRLITFLAVQFCVTFSYGQCVRIQLQDTSLTFNAMSFSDSDHGVVVGKHGITLWTSDGGSHWASRSIQDSLDEELIGVSMTGRDSAVVLAQHGAVFITSNQGATWSLATRLPYQGLRKMAFADGLHGMIAGDGGRIMRTDNGGAGWMVLSDPSIDNAIAITYPDLNHFIVGYSNYIMRTDNAGGSWYKQYPTYLRDATSSLVGIAFTDPSHGIVLTRAWLQFGRSPSWFLVAEQTSNGGATWFWGYKEIDTSFHDLRLLDRARAVTVATTGELASTTDGGTNWNIQPGVPENPRDIQYLASGNLMVLGAHTIFTISKTGCSLDSLFGAVSPGNGTEVSLTPDPLHPDLVPLVCSYAQTSAAVVTHIIFEFTQDPAFSAGIDTTIISTEPRATFRSVIKGPLTPGSAYYWRISAQYIDGTRANRTPLQTFTAGSGILRGFVFEDDNRDGMRNQNEPVLSNQGITISGDVSGSVVTDSAGMFSIEALGAGHYVVSQDVPATWVVSTPAGGSYGVTLQSHDTSSGYAFGRYFPWNSAGGVVFEDRNEDGIQEASEPGLPGWEVRAEGTSNNDSVITDSLGRYNFNKFLLYQYSISIAPAPSWEQINPQLQNPQGAYHNSYDTHYGSLNFAFHQIPPRVKLALRVSDTSPGGHRDIWFGVLPRATYGIWGADPYCTTADYSEGEFDLPPQLYGLFDARFVNPVANNPRFGFGSWTDMRSFSSITQVDTYEVSFRPAYIYGGDYPFTISWSPDQVASSYRGDVFITDGAGGTVNMKLAEHEIISNPDVKSVFIFAGAPSLSESDIPKWRLVSLPSEVADGSIFKLFRSSRSDAFSYSPGVGYVDNVSLAAGPGYWLNYATGQDSLPIGVPRTEDTLDVSSGWNLIGALSTPLDVRAFVTQPPNIILGRIFGYENGRYVEVDTLEPRGGYWIRSSQSGKLILSAASQSTPKELSRAGEPKLAEFNEINFSDAAGGSATLYFGGHEHPSLEDEFTAPPPSPQGLDVRFVSGRLLELVGPEGKKQVHITVSGGKYPLRVQWRLKQNSEIIATIRTGSGDFSLQHDGAVILQNELDSLALTIAGKGEIPKEFTLEQNYPNPFNPTTIIRYELPEMQPAQSPGAFELSYHVTMSVYNTLGQKVATLVDGPEGAGYKSVTWDASSFPTGVYFYRLTAGAYHASRKLLLLK